MHCGPGDKKKMGKKGKEKKAVSGGKFPMGGRY